MKTRLNPPRRLPQTVFSWRSLVAPAALAAALPLMAQDEDDDVITLSPFEVDATEDMGYSASASLAGTRIRTDLADLGSSISVITEEFLDDVGATDNETVLAYALGTEVGGPRGNFSGGVSGGSTPRESGLFASPNTNTRVRGLSQADNTRNFFRTDVPWDGYVVRRVDLQRGPNAILFGLGSPAGVVNATLDSADVNRTEGELEMRFDNFGTFRTSVNYNRSVLEGQLGVRVAGLVERQKFRQEPAFEDNDRSFVALKYKPNFLNSENLRVEFSGNWEHGNITSNRPRTLPPEDAISGFWRPLSENGVSKQTFNFFTDNEILDSNQDDFVGGVQSLFENSPTFIHNSPQPDVWNHNDMTDWGQRTPEGQIVGDYQRDENGDIVFDNDGNPIEITSAAGTVFGSNRRMLVLQQTVFWARQENVPFANDGFWENERIRDPRVFDVFNLLPEGDNKREWTDWDTYEFDASATLFRDKIGFNFGYFYQDLTRGQYGIQGWDNRIFIDINENRQDMSPNPDVGRAFINHNLASTGTSEGFRERDALRAQIFAEHNFREGGKNGLIARVLGRHRVTALYLEDNESADNRGYSLTGFGPSYERIHGDSDGRINPVFRSYISDDLRGLSGPEQANLSNVQQDVIPTSGSMVPIYYFDTTWTAGPGVDPGDFWDNNELDGDPDRNFQSYNPANYAGWTVDEFPIYFFQDDDTMVENTGLTAREYLTTSANLQEQTVESEVFVWQGWFWNEAIVGTYGLRNDKATSVRFQAPEVTVTAPNAYAAADGKVDDIYIIDDVSPSAYNIGNASDNDRFNLDTETENWSIAVHLNRILGERDFLPLNVSLYYNEGENFQPAAGRLDAFARPLPPPGGSTVDRSILVATKDNRFSVKVTKFETNVTNQNTTGDIGAMWALQQTLFAPTIARNNFRPASEGGTGNWSTDAHPDPDRLRNVILPAWDNFEVELQQKFPEYVDAWIWRGTWAPSNNQTNARRPAGHVFTEDAISEGYEIEFTANPTPNWRMTVNASKVEAIRDKVPGAAFLEVSEFIDDQMLNTPVGEMPVWWSASPGVATNIYPTYRGDYLKLVALNGQTQPEVREWRVNLVTNYNFSEGKWKGLGIGGSLRYESDTVLDYLPGTNADGDVIVDIDNPVRGDANTNVGLHVSYRFALNEKVDCRVQLNGYNVFGENELVPISLDPFGNPLGYRIREGASWALTTTFDF